MDISHEDAYKDGYRYLRSLVDPLDDELLALACPHCPEWSLKGVLAHLMAVIELTASQGQPGWLRQRVTDSIVNSDPVDREAAGVERDGFWNDLVASLEPLSLDELFDRWEAGMDQLSADQWSVGDFAVHLGDLEEALGASASLEMPLHALSLDRYTPLLIGHLEASNVPTVSLVGTAPEVRVGNEAASHRVRGSTYELLRTVTGRRSREEAEHLLDWTTTPAATKEVFPIYGWLPRSLRDVTVV